MNIFTQLHEDRDGNTTPIVSLQADHLVNIVNLNLQKKVTKALRQAEEELLGLYAPKNMDEKVRRSLGLRKMSDADNAKITQTLDNLTSQLQEKAFEYMMPYIVVGVCRNDTRNGIIAILQAMTGITGQVDLPGLTNHGGISGELVSGYNSDDSEAWTDED